MEFRHIIIILIVVLLLIKLLFNTVEGFGGALVQLYSKGPQDTYLTVDTDKYIYPYHYYRSYSLPYNYIPYYYSSYWNQSTRYPRSYPYYIPIHHRFEDDMTLLPY